MLCYIRSVNAFDLNSGNAVSKKLALELNKVFFEAIVSYGYKKDALKILRKSKEIS